MKKHFLTGLLLWLPIWAVYVVLRFFVDIFDKSLALIPAKYQPDQLLGFHIPGLGLIFTLIIVWITGLLTANFIGRQLVTWGETILNKIPLIRSIYSAAKNLLQAFVKPKEESFRQVVKIEFPRKGAWNIGFLTSPNVQWSTATEEELVAVFVPTTPNPTSGFLVFVPRDEVKIMDISVEDAFRMIVSLGVVQPGSQSGNPVHVTI